MSRMKTQVTFTKYDSSIAQTKSFKIASNGTIEKQATDQMYKGKATRITTDIEGFKAALNNADSKTAFDYGCHDQPRDIINIVTKANENISKGLFARNKENFQYRKAPGVMMYDLDNNLYGPTVSAERFIEILDELDPSYSTAAILVRGSVSAGVHKSGEASPFKNNSHLYIFVEDASDIPRHTKALADRLWLLNYGFYALNANGSLLDKTIVDGSVFSPEHLDFVGAPTLSKGLKYLPPEIIHFEGGLLNTCSLLDLTPDEQAKLIKIKAAARIAIEPEAIALHAKWRSERAVEMIAKGATEDESNADLDKMDVMKDGIVELPDSYILKFSDGTGDVRVRDVILNYKKYAGKNLYDPIEGPEYSNGCPTVAQYYYNESNDSHIINSFAHGESKYRLCFSLAIPKKVAKKSNNIIEGVFNVKPKDEAQPAPEPQLIQRVPPGFKVINKGDANPDRPPRLLSDFSICNNLEAMKKELKEQRFILSNIAIFGQSTVIYAKPNTGKTLLVLWMLMEEMKKGEIDGSKILYVNADDDYTGLIFKAEIAKQYGFGMATPGENGFESKALMGYMEEFIASGEAKDQVIILDTLKKFSDLMDKTSSAIFTERIAEFVRAQGTVIMLAHTNKNRDANGKLVFSGVSDIVDDTNCVYILDVVSAPDEPIKRVLFENIKRRANVAQKTSFTYDDREGISYLDRLNSVKQEDKNHTLRATADLAAQLRQEKDKDVISAIIQTMIDGHTEIKTIVKEANETFGFGAQRLKNILHKYKGTHWVEHSGLKNKKTYSIK